jgi:hypothetical protein
MAWVIPRAKMIVLLRNPVDRAFSHYRHNKSRGREDRTFKEAMRQESWRIDGEHERMVRGESCHSLVFQRNSYVSGGCIGQIRALSRHFDMKNILIVRSEDLRAEPLENMNRVLEFLGLDSWMSGDLPPCCVGKYIKETTAAHRCLEGYFRPCNRQLSEFRNEDFTW